jgi:hypothetical protein
VANAWPLYLGIPSMTLLQNNEDLIADYLDASQIASEVVWLYSSFFLERQTGRQADWRLNQVAKAGRTKAMSCVHSRACAIK